MGEEWGSKTPFLYFCDLGPELAPKVTEGRRGEFAKFPEFSDHKKRDAIPDPSDPHTFENSKLNWTDLAQSKHQHWYHYYQELLRKRRDIIVPLLAHLKHGVSSVDDNLLQVDWSGSANHLTLISRSHT